MPWSSNAETLRTSIVSTFSLLRNLDMLQSVKESHNKRNKQIIDDFIVEIKQTRDKLESMNALEIDNKKRAYEIELSTLAENVSRKPEGAKV